MKNINSAEELFGLYLSNQHILDCGSVADDQGGKCFAVWGVGADPSVAKLTFEHGRAVVCLNKSRYWFDLKDLYTHYRSEHNWITHLTARTWITPEMLVFINALYEMFPDTKRQGFYPKEKVS
ncbi:hypothetical protein [Polynucleobacter sp. es-MAR-4]|uniref:hypothetical protein n=1 Tax=Polynucleobacter sp. es-MAR-4 TaxID=1855655 RepID=UPI001C0B405D|nr:hypothetical protein [Polynucleobacter sp. es-MAR-4]MBU3637367.1 hypothetical protein [Polynucleobacter sp. es-MAR-4]